MRISQASFSPPALPSADDALEDKFDQLECGVDSKQATEAERDVWGRALVLKNTNAL